MAESATTFRVVRVQAGDVPELVRVHAEAFPEFFLTMLGPRFLARMYRAMIASPEALALCAVAAEGGLCGFAVGPLRPAGFFRSLFLREGLGFAFDALPALLRRPGFVAARLWRGVRYRGEAPAELPGAALLSSIAVSPRQQGRGIAGPLLAAFHAEACARGATGVYLTTDRDGNPGVNRFYLRQGYTCRQQLERPDGRAMNVYWKPCMAHETPARNP